MLEFKKVLPHDIHITSSANGGYIVTVGCCITVFNTAVELLDVIDAYSDEEFMHQIQEY